MHHKDIKRIIIKQLKSEYPQWKKLPKRKKKEIAKKVLDEVVKGYDFKGTIQWPLEELLGVEGQKIDHKIKSLAEMARFIEGDNSGNLIDVTKYPGYYNHIKDNELKFIDSILDNQIINRLLSYDGYSPSRRDILPCNFLRAEILKAFKYPEISYRKYCNEEYLGLERKENRVFIGLPLNKKIMIDHTQMSQFRSKLTFSQMVNLLVYVLYHFNKSGLLGGCVLYGVDSTELANDCRCPWPGPA